MFILTYPYVYLLRIIKDFTAKNKCTIILTNFYHFIKGLLLAKKYELITGFLNALSSVICTELIKTTGSSALSLSLFCFSHSDIFVSSCLSFFKPFLVISSKRTQYTRAPLINSRIQVMEIRASHSESVLFFAACVCFFLFLSVCLSMTTKQTQTHV